MIGYLYNKKKMSFQYERKCRIYFILQVFFYVVDESKSMSFQYERYERNH